MRDRTHSPRVTRIALPSEITSWPSGRSAMPKGQLSEAGKAPRRIPLDPCSPIIVVTTPAGVTLRIGIVAGVGHVQIAVGVDGNVRCARKSRCGAYAVISAPLARRSGDCRYDVRRIDSSDRGAAI